MEIEIQIMPKIKKAWEKISCYVFSLCFVINNERITENILIMLLNGEKW